jgi:hypothetical protein
MKKINFLLLVLAMLCHTNNDAQGVSQTIGGGNMLAKVSNKGTLIDSILVFDPNTSLTTTALNDYSIWLGGLDPAGNLLLALQSKDALQNDFLGGFRNRPGSDKVWKVTDDEVRQHLADFELDQVVDNPIPSIFSWPANGNQFSQSLNGFSTDGLAEEQGAPFLDRNFNKIYEPHLGEYPAQDLDVRYLYEQANYSELVFAPFYTKPLVAGAYRPRIPVSGSTLLVAYHCQESFFLSNTLFGRIRLHYERDEDINSLSVGFLTDIRAGNGHNDFMGSDVAKGMFYCYDGDSLDTAFGGKSPMFGVASYTMSSAFEPFAAGSYVPPIGMMPMNIKYDGFIDPRTSFPELPAEIYYYLTGSWRDGTPLTSGGSGLNDGSINFVDSAFPGKLDNPNEWSEISAQNQPGKRAFLLRYTAHEIPACSTKCRRESTNFAFFNVPSGNTPVAQKIQMDSLSKWTSEWYNFHGFPSLWANAPCLDPLTNTNNPISNNPQVKVYPNPVQNILHLDFGAITPNWVSLLDITSRHVRAVQPSAPVFDMDVSELPIGVYLLHWHNESNVGSRVVVVGR